MKKRLVSFILVLVVTLSLMPTVTFAANTTGFAGGSGTEADPYLISNKTQLNNVRYYPDAHFKLTCDIEFTDVDFAEGGDFYNNGQGFVPIGADYNSMFEGTFDGNGFSILKLKINFETNTTQAYAGLFGYNKGTIKNLGIELANISATYLSSSYSYSGCIVARNYGYIENCHSSGLVKSNRYAGGITGYNENGIIISCYNDAQIITSSTTIDLCSGGIVGYNENGTISNCYNTGTISSDEKITSDFSTTYYSYSGGIVANSRSGEIENCYNLGQIFSKTDVTITNNYDDAYSRAYSGGIVGCSTNTIITECYNIGEIYSNSFSDSGRGWYDKAWAYSGGITGTNGNKVFDCYNTGRVDATSSSGASFSGGISGTNSGNIKQCYSISSDISASNKGGIIAGNDGSISNCFYIKGGTYSSFGATGYYINSFYSQNTYSGFDFDNIWQMGDSKYPFPILKNINNHAEFDCVLEENTVDFAGGTGLESDPFVIETITHLKNIKKYNTSYYIIANDIIFNSGSEEFPEEWVPFAFNGILDGNGFSIKNIKVDYNLSRCYNPGLFTVNNGTIKNLTLENTRIFISVYAQEYGGFIVAENNGTISNCYSNNCSITLGNAEHYFGCIAGKNTGLIQKCTSNNVINWGSVGGEVGGIVSDNVGTIKDCTNNTSITNIGSSSPISGGIVAKNSGIIITSRNLKPIYSNSTSSQYASSSGGIVGVMSNGKISQCYNSGAITTEATEYKANTYSGGIVAYISDGDILDCYNTGDIYGEPNSYSASCYVGGIVGYNNSIGTLKNCYSIGGNSGRASSANLYVGYICGYNASNSIENCYYLGVVNNGSGSGDCSTMYGKNVTALKNQDTYTGFDFNSIWKIQGDIYAYLQLINNPHECNHVFSNVYSNDEIKHWYSCDNKGCNIADAKAQHVFENECDTDCECGYVRAVPAHKYDNSCDTSCNVCGATRTITHTYDNDCDTTCNVCGAAHPTSHKFGGYIYNNDATYEKDGTKTATCSVCGETDTVTAEGTKLIKNGWIYEGGWVYYENGVKLTNCWLADSVGWCYVGSDGYCLTNCWMADSIGWCYLNAEGRMATNQWIMDSQGWCYVGADGYCVTNQWMADSIGWCYLNAEGRMATNQWIMDSQGWCYVGSDGYCLTNCWMADSIGWCYLDASGRMVVNDWVRDSQGLCWLDENGYWNGIYN